MHIPRCFEVRCAGGEAAPIVARSHAPWWLWDYENLLGGFRVVLRALFIGQGLGRGRVLILEVQLAAEAWQGAAAKDCGDYGDSMTTKLRKSSDTLSLKPKPVFATKTYTIRSAARP